MEISVVMSTYNRAAMLPAALDALLAQAGGVPYEVIVVDNNSSDQTQQVVDRYVERHPGKVRYVLEPAQGLSHGRNTGIRAARGGIIAFTDDDVEVAPDWIVRLKQAFDQYPAAGYIGGRVLPRWKEPPPRWLSDAHWSPLALQDYGDHPVRVGPFWPVCLVGANLAFRRDVFHRVGLFTPDFGRIMDGIGSTEDHDMQLRMWQAGLQGVYVPGVRMVAEIPPDRMQKRYHRRWHKGHGRHCARMRLREIVPQDMAPMGRPPDLVMFYGAPAFVYREVLVTAWRWAQSALGRRDPFFYGNRMRQLTRYLTQSWKLHRAGTGRSAPAELWRFMSVYLRKRLRARRAGAAPGAVAG
jgi:glucosyl-dolichyl phosphate glucuronosyltransferase